METKGEGQLEEVVYVGSGESAQGIQGENENYFVKYAKEKLRVKTDQSSLKFRNVRRGTRLHKLRKAVSVEGRCEDEVHGVIIKEDLESYQISKQSSLQGIRRMEKIEKTDLMDSGLSLSSCGKFIIKVNMERRRMFLSGNVMGSRSHVMNGLEFDSHQAAESVLSVNGPIVDKQLSEADKTDMEKREEVEPRNVWAIFTPGGTERRNNLTPNSRKHKKSLESVSQVSLTGKSPKQPRLCNKNGLLVTEGVSNPSEFVSPAREFVEDNVLELGAGTVAGQADKGDILMMDENRIKGILDSHSVKLGREVTEALQTTMTSLTSRFQNDAQSFLDTVVARFSSKESELVAEIDEKFQEIDAKQTDTENKFEQLEMQVTRQRSEIETVNKNASDQVDALAGAIEGRLEHQETEMQNLNARMETFTQEVVGRLNGMSESLMEQVEISVDANLDQRADRIGDLFSAARVAHTTEAYRDERLREVVEAAVTERTGVQAEREGVTASLLARIEALEEQNRAHNRLTKEELDLHREELKRARIRNDNYWLNSIKIHQLGRAQERVSPRYHARKELGRLDVAHVVDEAENILVGEDGTSVRLTFKSFSEMRRAFSDLAAASKRHQGRIRFHQLIPKRFGDKFERLKNKGKEKLQRKEIVRFFFFVKNDNLGIKMYRTHRSNPEILMDEVPVNPEEERVCRVCLGELSERVQRLHCGHAFHLVCIDVWLASHPSCPTCRTAMVINRHTPDQTSNIHCSFCIRMPDPTLAVNDSDYKGVVAIGCRHAHHIACYKDFLEREIVEEARIPQGNVGQVHHQQLSLLQAPRCRACKDDNLNTSLAVQLGPEEMGQVLEFISPSENSAELAGVPETIGDGNQSEGLSRAEISRRDREDRRRMERRERNSRRSPIEPRVERDRGRAEERDGERRREERRRELRFSRGSASRSSDNRPSDMRPMRSERRHSDRPRYETRRGAPSR